LKLLCILKEKFVNIFLYNYENTSIVLLEFEITSVLVTGDPGRLGTLIYVFTVETPQPMEARHNSCTLLLYVPVYYSFAVVSAVIVKPRIMCMYAYYTVVLVPGDPLLS
jgi:hypothetical protein